MTLSAEDRTGGEKKKKERKQLRLLLHMWLKTKAIKRQWLKMPLCTVLGIVKSIEVVNLHKKLNIFNGTGRWADPKNLK